MSQKKPQGLVYHKGRLSDIVGTGWVWEVSLDGHTIQTLPGFVYAWACTGCQTIGVSAEELQGNGRRAVGSRVRTGGYRCSFDFANKFRRLLLPFKG